MIDISDYTQARKYAWCHILTIKIRLTQFSSKIVFLMLLILQMVSSPWLVMETDGLNKTTALEKLFEVTYCILAYEEAPKCGMGLKENSACEQSVVPLFLAPGFSLCPIPHLGACSQDNSILDSSFDACSSK